MNYSRKRKATGYSKKRYVKKNRPMKMPRPTNKYMQLLNSSSNSSEIKTVDIDRTAKQIVNTGTFVLLNGTTEGASFYNRIGRKIAGKSVRIQGQIIGSGNVTLVQSEYIRVMVIYDRQTNGAFPTVADVLTNYDYTGATTTTSFSYLNMNNIERFVVLRDTHFHIPDNDFAGTQTSGMGSIIDYKNNCNYDEYIKLGKLETHYKNSTGLVGDITTGGIYLLLLGNVAAGSNGYQMQYSIRYRFHDN